MPSDLGNRRDLNFTCRNFPTIITFHPWEFSQFLVPSLLSNIKHVKLCCCFFRISIVRKTAIMVDASGLTRIHKINYYTPLGALEFYNRSLEFSVSSPTFSVLLPEVFQIFMISKFLEFIYYALIFLQFLFSLQSINVTFYV